MAFLTDNPVLAVALIAVTVAWALVLRARWRQARLAAERVLYDPGRYG